MSIRIIPICLVAIAAALPLITGTAQAQKLNSRSVVTPPPPTGGGGGGVTRPPSGGHHGGGGGFRGPGWGAVVPGLIIMTVPHLMQPRGDVVYEDDDYVDQPRRRPPQRAAQPSRPSGVPPASERRYVPDEVVIELRNTVAPRQVDALQRRHRLTRLESQPHQLSGTTLYRWRIPDRRSVPQVVRQLERDNVVASAQPNYVYTLQDDAAKPAGDPAQYEVAKLRLPQAHQIAGGADVIVAVIDSGVDAAHPELTDSVIESFNAAATPMAPHSHGTAIAALIAGHGKLLGAAPKAKLLAVRAFDPNGGSADGTTFAILKGLDWAVANKARVINMSFAGPSDPAMLRSLAAAHKKGIVLIAAAGNAGPKSPPLYPAADPNVIAVSATDADDKLFAQSNRGRHIAIAAPGDQLLVAVPGGYEVSSGTSYSAAEISGVVALMIERDPKLTPAKALARLQAAARDLGPKGRDSDFGAGLADAFGAVSGDGAAVAADVPIAPVRPVKAGLR